MRGRFLAGLGLVAWSALIWSVSSMSRPPRLPGGLGDKGIHFLAFSVHGFLVRGVMPPAVAPVAGWLAAAGVSSAWGAVDEYHQSFVPGRDSSALDWVADTAGGLVGAALYALAARRRS